MAEMEKKEQSKTEYLQEIAQELLDDETWELPKEARTVKAILTGFDGSVTWSQPIRL